jgi:DNA-binding NarL/FixJ family response regulator
MVGAHHGRDGVALLAHDAREAEEVAARAVDAREQRRARPFADLLLEVLELLAEGLPNRAIAARLAISDQTVKFHVAAVMAKLGAANRTDAVRLAARRGLVVL